MSRAVRKGQNEVWFRDLNERIEQRALVKHGMGEPFEIVCECHREECTERVSIRPIAYEAARTTPTEFIVAHGHADRTYERIVDSTVEYEVVEKSGEAAVVAEIENPRS